MYFYKNKHKNQINKFIRYRWRLYEWCLAHLCSVCRKSPPVALSFCFLFSSVGIKPFRSFRNNNRRSVAVLLACLIISSVWRAFFNTATDQLNLQQAADESDQMCNDPVWEGVNGSRAWKLSPSVSTDYCLHTRVVFLKQPINFYLPLQKSRVLWYQYPLKRA